jgi:hypothetical protein
MRHAPLGPESLAHFKTDSLVLFSGVRSRINADPKNEWKKIHITANAKNIAEWTKIYGSLWFFRYKNS